MAHHNNSCHLGLYGKMDIKSLTVLIFITPSCQDAMSPT